METIPIDAAEAPPEAGGLRLPARPKDEPACEAGVWIIGGIGGAPFAGGGN